MLNNLPHGFNALIVGASGGLGYALGEALLGSERAGQVFLSARQPGSIEAIQELVDTHVGRSAALALDVTDEDSITAAASQLGERVGELHLLINCAGVLHDAHGLRPEKRWEDVDPQSLMRSFQVNAFGHMLVAKHFLGLMRHRDTAILANVSARVGSIEDNHIGGWYAYRAAKAAQNQFTRTLSVESARRARRVICVALHPGTTDTPLSEPFQARVPEGKLFSPAYSAERLLEVLSGVGPQDNGAFLAWDGQRIPW